eukprot:TRINITY_DN41303_c0_g1_i1.p1 TRINITY_DN41303_c0_g1~~TRINITY_DN41303_c0_g1_i1.p1  ORF type:complete len:819 (+),score=177.58 TRINITY_DN41303_c0_g1_i1:198-2654(+)
MSLQLPSRRTGGAAHTLYHASAGGGAMWQGVGAPPPPMVAMQALSPRGSLTLPMPSSAVGGGVRTPRQSAPPPGVPMSIPATPERLVSYANGRLAAVPPILAMPGSDGGKGAPAAGASSSSSRGPAPQASGSNVVITTLRAGSQEVPMPAAFRPREASVGIGPGGLEQSPRLTEWPSAAMNQAGTGPSPLMGSAWAAAGAAAAAIAHAASSSGSGTASVSPPLADGATAHLRPLQPRGGSMQVEAACKLAGGAPGPARARSPRSASSLAAAPTVVAPGSRHLAPTPPNPWRPGLDPSTALAPSSPREALPAHAAAGRSMRLSPPPRASRLQQGNQMGRATVPARMQASPRQFVHGPGPPPPVAAGLAPPAPQNMRGSRGSIGLKQPSSQQLPQQVPAATSPPPVRLSAVPSGSVSPSVPFPTASVVPPVALGQRFVTAGTAPCSQEWLEVATELERQQAVPAAAAAASLGAIAVAGGRLPQASPRSYAASSSIKPPPPASTPAVVAVPEGPHQFGAQLRGTAGSRGGGAEPNFVSVQKPSSQKATEEEAACQAEQRPELPAEDAWHVPPLTMTISGMSTVTATPAFTDRTVSPSPMSPDYYDSSSFSADSRAAARQAAQAVTLSLQEAMRPVSSSSSTAAACAAAAAAAAASVEAGTGGSVDEAQSGLIQDLLRTIEGWRQADEEKEATKRQREEIARLHAEEAEARRQCQELQEMVSELNCAQSEKHMPSAAHEAEDAELARQLDRQQQEILALRSELAEARLQGAVDGVAAVPMAAAWRHGGIFPAAAPLAASSGGPARGRTATRGSPRDERGSYY